LNTPNPPPLGTPLEEVDRMRKEAVVA